MPMKPNYKFERAERARSKEAKKLQKRNAQAARHQSGSAAESGDAAGAPSAARLEASPPDASSARSEVEG